MNNNIRFLPDIINKFNTIEKRIEYINHLLSIKITGISEGELGYRLTETLNVLKNDLESQQCISGYICHHDEMRRKLSNLLVNWYDEYLKIYDKELEECENELTQIIESAYSEIQQTKKANNETM